MTARRSSSPSREGGGGSPSPSSSSSHCPAHAREWDVAALLEARERGGGVAERSDSVSHRSPAEGAPPWDGGGRAIVPERDGGGGE